MLPYRRYFAVTRVAPRAHYFVVSTRGVRAFSVHARAFYGPSGALEVELESPQGAGFAVDRMRYEPVPPELELVAREVSERVKRACRLSEASSVRYAGTHRDVTVEEVLLRAPAGMPERDTGWQATSVVALDPDLSEVLRAVHGRGTLRPVVIPKNAQFLSSSGDPAWRLDPERSLPSSLDAGIVEAARRFDRGLSPRSLASLFPPGTEVIPSELFASLRLTVLLNVPFRLAPTARSEEMTVLFTLRDAVFGTGASGRAHVTIDGTSFALAATLTPARPEVPQRGYRVLAFDGTLAVRIEDEHARAWERSYPVTGPVVVDGEGAMALQGLDVSGGPPWSDAGSRRRGVLPATSREREARITVGAKLSLEEEWE
jgi:hypothetical protein